MNLLVFVSLTLIKFLLFFQKTFTKEDVAALKSKLQKLKGQSETVTTPSPAPVSALAELKARLDAAREISAKVQQRKAERVAEDAKVTEAQAEPEAEERWGSLANVSIFYFTKSDLHWTSVVDMCFRGGWMLNSHIVSLWDRDTQYYCAN